MQYTYLLLDILSISVPLLYSFHPKMNLIRWWKPLFKAISITALLFIVWDIFFSYHGVWGFNPKFLIGINILHLPLEEWLFFWMIPYASLFIYFSLQYYKPNWQLQEKRTSILSVFLLVVSFLIVIFNIDKWYTLVNYAMLFIILLYTFLFKKQLLNRFYIAFVIVLIPFILVNGTLTGMFTEEPVVWYNNTENLGIRFITIPVEDFAYAFTMLLMSLVFIDRQIQISWDIK